MRQPLTRPFNFEDMRLIPQKSIVASRSEVRTAASFSFQSHNFASPVVPANMESILTPEICKEFDDDKWFYIYHRIKGPTDVLNFVKQAQEFRVVSISVGIKGEWLDLINTLKFHNLRVDYFTIDIAHSHTEAILPILRLIKSLYPDAVTICGNGCTAEWAKFLTNTGLVDCIKVGIGVSASCRTMQYTGFGSSTGSSLIECVEAVRWGRAKVMSDGGLTVKDGCVWIGDVAKALALGADFVMSGALFSRCIDSPAVVKGYYGNASREAKGDTHVEGELIKVASNGLTMKQMRKLIIESLQSSCSYAGKTATYTLRGAKYQII